MGLRPRNSSRKAIDRQAKDTSGSKEALVELKKNLNEYKATVRNNRLQVKIKEGQGNSALARSLHAERAKQINHSFMTSAEVVSGVSQNTDVLWLASSSTLSTTSTPRGWSTKRPLLLFTYFHGMCIHNK